MWRPRAERFNKDKVSASRIINGATKVEPYRIVEWIFQPLKPGIGKVEGIPYAAKGPTQGTDFAERLSEIVLDTKSYTFTHKACAFNPTVAFRVVNGEESVTVLICFGCNQLLILEKDAPLRKIAGFEGRFKVNAEFDLFRPELLALAREALPNDKSLKDMPTYKTGFINL